VTGPGILKKITPEWLRTRIRTWFPNRMLAWTLRSFERVNEFADEARFGRYEGDPGHTLGVVREFAHYHRFYVAACRDMNVSYKVLDLAAADWIERFRDSGCDAFLVWPSELTSVWTQMYLERLEVLVEDLGGIIYPSYRELWLWGSKRRMRDWMAARGIPHPETHVFYREEEARDFLRDASFPLVFKTDHGSQARGVAILRSRRQAGRLVRRAFTRGIRPLGEHPCNREWGCVVFQEYVPAAEEWRMVRVGDSYFGHVKAKKGDFHSGSGVVGWQRPPDELLDFVRDVTEKGGFTSMNVDVFATLDGRYLINELQALFGSKREHQMILDGRPGRFLFREGKWVFEEGTFTQNNCCNLRVEELLRQLDRRRPT